jgi:hypothetical protein
MKVLWRHTALSLVAVLGAAAYDLGDEKEPI